MRADEKLTTDDCTAGYRPTAIGCFETTDTHGCTRIKNPCSSVPVSVFVRVPNPTGYRLTAGPIAVRPS